MSAWLFDLGNSRLKYASRGEDGAIGAMAAIDHRDTGFAALPQAVRGETAWLAAVGPSALQAGLLDILSERFARVSLARTSATCGALRIAYAAPQRLGVDRFLALLAACAQRQAILLVGVGTALTVDLLDGHGRHRGGRIAPSPTLMRECLQARAARLPARGGSYRAFADDTVDALASGCEGAALALVEQSRDLASQALGTTPRLWLHGGGAAGLLPRLADAALHPGLVLQGLARYAALGDAGPARA